MKKRSTFLWLLLWVGYGMAQTTTPGQTPSSTSPLIKSLKGSKPALQSPSQRNVPLCTGVPAPTTIIQEYGPSICYDVYTDYWFSVQNPQSGVAYKWGVQNWDGSVTMYTGYDYLTTVLFRFQPGSYAVFAIPYNDCGEGYSIPFDLYVNNPWDNCDARIRPFTLSVGPNPTQGDLTVTISGTKSPGTDENTEMTLYGLFTQQVVKQWRFNSNQNQFTLNVRGVKKGQYVLQIKKGNYKQVKQIMIN